MKSEGTAPVMVGFDLDRNEEAPVPGCAITPTRFDTPADLALEAAFDGGRLTSEGGLPWLAKNGCRAGAVRDHGRARTRVAARGFCEAPAARIREAARLTRWLAATRTRNDANSIRADPLLKLACGRPPETGADLASQPTISRMENAPSARACYRIAAALGEIYVEQRAKSGVPERVLLDFASTEDPTHGGQEGSYYHGYYGQHMYHPLLVFDGKTGQIVTAVLPSGKTRTPEPRGGGDPKAGRGPPASGVALRADGDPGRRRLRGACRLGVV